MGENEFIENDGIFTLGDFNVTSNLSPTGDSSKIYQYGDILTLESLPSTTNEYFSPLSAAASQNIEKLDLSNPRLYIKYSSFVERIRGSLENIINSYPSSLKLSKLIVGYSYGDVNIIDIQYDPNSDTTSFFVLTNYLDNPGHLAYISGVNGISQYKDFTKNYFNYLFDYEGYFYNILDITPASKVKNDKIGITVAGRPFDTDGPNVSAIGYITPSNNFINEYLQGVDFFERYLLKDNFRIKDSIESDGGQEYEYNLLFSLPRKDKYNYDFESKRYEKFLTDFLTVAVKYDEKHLNVTSRKLIPQSFQDISINSDNFPTYGKANKLLNIFSFYFDSLYGNINALKFYDQINLNDNSFENRDSILRLSKTLGFDALGGEKNNFISTENLKPFIKNIPYLLNSKGTRQGILTALNYLNIPNELIELNEKIYATNAINYETLKYYYEIIDSGLTLANTPVKQDGTPDLSKVTEIFHSNGYFNSLSNLLPAIEDNFFLNSNVSQYSEELVNFDFNLSGDTLEFGLYNINWSALACFSYTGGTIVNPLPESFFDNCNCKIQLDDLSLQICATPINPYDTYCPPLIVDVVPNCVALQNTGTTLSGDTSCVFGLTLYSSDDVENVVKPADPIPVNYISFPYKLSLTSCNSSYDENYLLEQQVTSVHYYHNDFALMNAGGYVSAIRLHDTISSSPHNLILNPYTTPYLTGCSGTLNAADLLFPSGTTLTELNTWANNLQILIENAICTVYSTLPIPPENNVTYFMSVEAFGDGSFNINFNNKNNPISPEYNIGINKNNASISLFDGTSSYNSNSYYSKFDNLTINYTGNTICGELHINKAISEVDLNANVDANYDEIVFDILSPTITTIDNGSLQERVCLIGGNLTGDTFNYGAYLNVNVYGGIPPYSFTGITQGQFFNSGDTYSFFVGDSGCNIVQVTGDVVCNEDLCFGNKVNTKIVQTIETITKEVEVECPIVDITHTMYLSGNGSMVGQMTSYDYVLEFNNFEVLNSPYYEIEIQGESNTFNYTGNTSTFNATISYVISSLSQNIGVYIRLFDGDCVFEQETEVFSLEYGLVEEDTSDDTLLAPSYIEVTEEQILVDKTVYEITPKTPVLNGTYICNENGTATLSLQVSGGTTPYKYYGGVDGEIVENGEQLSIYVEDANECVSNIETLTIDCNDESVNCESINLQASIETTSLDSINETATITFTYNITGLSFDESIEEVSMVISGVGSSNNYILGSPIMKTFYGEFGAEQIYLDFTPDVLTNGTYKIIMIIKTENCTYSDVFEMSVDASILSDVDNYSNILG